MSLRRPRSHRVGISNIDFRSKKDEENLKIFEPWQVPKDFGTMGYKKYSNPIRIARDLFGPTKKINTLKDISNDYPDPRYFTTAQFYKDNNIKINTKSFRNLERTSNLEERIKGKDAFNGDSTNIAEIMRQRKGKKIDDKNIKNKLFTFEIEEKKERNNKIEKLSKEKKKINKNVIQETQLVKLNVPHTMDNIINKIIEIFFENLTKII